eukprot:3292667-Amphidinium_carterae.1
MLADFANSNKASNAEEEAQEVASKTCGAGKGSIGKCSNLMHAVTRSSLSASRLAITFSITLLLESCLQTLRENGVVLGCLDLLAESVPPRDRFARFEYLNPT